MDQKQWKILTPVQKTEILHHRTQVHECDILESRRDIAILQQQVDDLMEYTRELDNRLDSLAYLIQELVAVLKTNQQVTQEQAETITCVNQ